MEESFGGWHSHEGRYLTRSSGLAGDRHNSRVSAKISDIRFHPLQCRHAVQNASVARIGISITVKFTKVKKPENVQPVSDRNQHHIVLFTQIAAVVTGSAAGACRET